MVSYSSSNFSKYLHVLTSISSISWICLSSTPAASYSFRFR